MSMRPFRDDEAGFAGVGLTYCRVPLVLDAAGLAGADVVVVGAPFDDGVSYRPGTRFGPRAIRQAEDVGDPGPRPHMELGVDPFAELRVVDYGDVATPPASLETSHANLRQALGEVYAAGAVSVVLGGDHSLSWPTLQALAERHGPDGYSVVHLDTHADTGADIHGNTNNHGTPFYLGATEGAMRGANIVQVGLRGAWPFPDEFQWMRDQGFRWHTMDEIDERGLSAVAGRRHRPRPLPRAADVPHRRHRRARPGLRTGHRHPGARRADDARAAARGAPHRRRARPRGDGHRRGRAAVRPRERHGHGRPSRGAGDAVGDGAPEERQGGEAGAAVTESRTVRG